MSNTNNKISDGLEFNNNVSIIKDCIGKGGSLEAEDTIFSDTFLSYTFNTPILLANSLFNQDGSVIITSSVPANSCNTTNASLIVSGGILVKKDSVMNGILRICNTTNSSDSSTGSLIISGGASIYKNLSLNGILSILNSTSSTSTSGSIITLGGITISCSTNSFNISNGGALTVVGGASFLGDIYSNNFYGNQTFITNGNFFNITSSNLQVLSGNFINISSNSLTSSIINSNNLYSNNISSNNNSVTNLHSTYSTFANTFVFNEITTNLTTNNLYNNNGFISVFNSTIANINVLTVGSLHVTNAIEYNDIITNISTSNIISNFSSVGSLQLSIGTFGSLSGILSGSFLYSDTISTSNLRSINIITTNTSTANLTVTNSITNIGTISNLQVTSSYINNLSSNNSVITNGTINNLCSNSGIINYVISNQATIDSLQITGTVPSISSTESSLTLYFGGLSINNTVDTSSLTSGGALTIAGGASIFKSLNVGNTISTQVISSSNIYTNFNTNVNNYSIYSTSGRLFLTSTQPSISPTSGALVSAGGISIFNTTDVTSITSGGGFTDAGGASIAKSLLVGGTIKATVISTGSAIIGNLNTISFTAQDALLTNVSISNLSVSSQTVNNLFVNNSSFANANFNNISSNNLNSSFANISTLIFTNGSYGTLLGNYLSANYITNNISLQSQNATINSLNSNNSSFGNIQIINGTFGGLIGNNLETYTGSIKTLLSLNASIGNLSTITSTTQNLITTNITTSSIIGTNLNFIYSTIGTLYASNIITNALSIGNLNVSQSSIGNLNLNYETVSNSLISNLSSYSVNITNSTIQNITNIFISSSYGNFFNISSGNANIINLFSTNGNYVNITSQNIYSNFIYTTNGSFVNSSFQNTFITNSTISNINNNTFLSNYSTISNLYVINNNSINTTTTNLVAINQTVNTLLSTDATSINLTVTNETVNTLNVSKATFGNINFTGNLYQNGLPYIASQWTSFGSNIAFTSGNVGINTTNPSFTLDIVGTGHFTQNVNIDGNISTSNIYASNISVGNINNAISISSQLLSSTNIFSTNSTTTNFVSSYSTISNALLSSSTINNLYSNIVTLGNLYINSSIPSYSSTTGTLILQNGGISVNCTVNSTGISSGGAITLAGGLSVFKDTYIGGNIHITGASYITGNTWLNSPLDLNQNVINNVTSPSLDLQVSNKWYVDNRFLNFTVGNVNGNFTRGQVIIATTAGNIIGFNNLTFDGITLTLNSTEDATSLTHGGALQIYGGASIDQSLFVGSNAHILGYLDMNNQKITSVAIPTTAYDAANKYYVDNRFSQFTIGNVSGNFTQGQVLVSSTSGHIIGYSDFLYDGTLLSLTSTNNSLGLGSGGTLTVFGGASILGNVYIGNKLDLNGNLITNVTSPNSNLDVANKYYVDNRFNQLTIGNVSGNFTQGQVIVAGTYGNLTGFSNFLFNGNLLSLNSSIDALGLGSGGTLNIYGGASFLKNVYFGSLIDLNNNFINNVATPSLDLQAANKYYVDQSISSANTINGNFSSGQIIVGGNIHGTLIGYSNFLFNGSTLNLTSTNPASGLGSGGSLNISGGVSILENMYIKKGLDVNNRKITNVGMCFDPNDGVPKSYVDFFLGLSNGDIHETSFLLNNSQNIPTNIDGFIFNNTKVSSFEAIVYLEIPEINIYDQWEINGVLKGTKWQISTKFIGDNPSQISFSITNNGQIQYTNNNSIGTALLRFRANTTSQGTYTNITISNRISNEFFTQGCILFGNSSSANSSINTDINFTYNNQLLFLGNTELSTNLTSGGALQVAGGVNIVGNTFIGNGLDINNTKITNVGMCFNPNDGVPKSYVDFFLGLSNGDIRETSFLLNNSQNIPTNINGFIFNNTKVSSFEAIVYLEIPELSIYDQWEINGILKGTIWQISTRFIGDNPSQVTFSITNNGQIQYTNKNLFGTALLRFRANTTSQGIYTNITINNTLVQVHAGGTGNQFFTQGCLLFGNNNNPINSSINLSYNNKLLFLGNTDLSSNLTSGGALQVAGGVNIVGNTFIGSGLDVNNQKITNLATCVNNFDSANKLYVDSKFGSSTGSLSLGGTILFSNTTNATSSTTGGALTDMGGAGFAKDVYVGGKLYVDDINLTPNTYDIFSQQSFNAINNQSSYSNIPNFNFSNNTRYFTAWITVNIIASNNLFAAFTLEGIQLDINNWQVNSKFIGQITDVNFTCVNGQIKYTSSNIPGWISTIIKFRAITITT